MWFVIYRSHVSFLLLTCVLSLIMFIQCSCWRRQVRSQHWHWTNTSCGHRLLSWLASSIGWLSITRLMVNIMIICVICLPLILHLLIKTFIIMISIALLWFEWHSSYTQLSITWFRGKIYSTISRHIWILLADCCTSHFTS